MEEGFELPVLCKGKEMLLPVKVLSLGYIYKLQIDVNGTDIIFERDEERNWRALLDPAKNDTAGIDIQLLKAICFVLDEVQSR